MSIALSIEFATVLDGCHDWRFDAACGALDRSRRHNEAETCGAVYWLMLLCLAALTPGVARAAELQPRTSQAYDAYLEAARHAFLARVRSSPVALPHGAEGILFAGPAREDGIISLPGGLVHHWVARAFIHGVTLKEVVDVSSAFGAYRTVYKAVIASQLLAIEGDTYHVLLRVKEREAGITAVLQIASTVQYVYPTSGTAYAMSHAHEIREVKDAGTRDEELLPAGRDGGYLWRANTFTQYVEHANGVYVETETLALSRQFPPLLGWFIEPIARRLGRRSSESSMLEFLAAIRRRSPNRSGVHQKLPIYDIEIVGVVRDSKHTDVREDRVGRCTPARPGPWASTVTVHRLCCGMSRAWHRRDGGGSGSYRRTLHPPGNEPQNLEPAASSGHSSSDVASRSGVAAHNTVLTSPSRPSARLTLSASDLAGRPLTIPSLLRVGRSGTQPLTSPSADQRRPRVPRHRARRRRATFCRRFCSNDHGLSGAARTAWWPGTVPSPTRRIRSQGEV